MIRKDSSDDFFQSKHINKRKEELRERLEENKREVLPKLKNGLEKIRIACDNKIWMNEEEESFLKMFSELHISYGLKQKIHHYGYHLSDLNDRGKAFYDLITDDLLIDYFSICKVFYNQFDMYYADVHFFLEKMLKKHFKLYDINLSFDAFINDAC